MKIAIDIPDFKWLENQEDFRKAVNEYEQGTRFDKEIRKALINGTPLPEHHGRLIDADMLEEKVEKHRKMLKISTYDRDLLLHYTDIEMAPTIIEGSESE